MSARDSYNSGVPNRNSRVEPTPATPSGSGITDLTGDVLATGPGSAVATIDNKAVTYAKIQDTAGSSILLGRGQGAGTGPLEEISLGSGLSMSGTTLSATSTAPTINIIMAHIAAY